MPELHGFERRVLQSGFWEALTKRTILPLTLKGIRLPESGDVLEVGSGGGFNAERLLESFPGWRLTATDFDPEMVARSAERLARFPGLADAVQADATALQFENASFDVVISMFVWHHVEDPAKATVEAARVLRPRGRLLLVDLSSGFFPASVARFLPPMTRYRLRDIRDALDSAGFRRRSVRTIGPLYRALAEKPA